MAVTVVCTVWKETNVCVVVNMVVGATVPWLLGDGIGKGDTMTEDMTGTTGAELEGEVGGVATTGLLDAGTAALLELTGSGMIVSVIGVTPADETGVTVVVSVPIVNDRENVGTGEMLGEEAGGEAGGAADGAVLDVEAALASAVLEGAAGGDTGCVMVETKVDKMVEIEVVVCVYVVPEMVIVAVIGQMVVVW
ncbi:hypothetical protein MMC15_008160 [Xylographa vitiligo]|nr:hypothetical protein [Xylographa vitiligo]